jgi:hypothetical protein
MWIKVPPKRSTIKRQYTDPNLGLPPSQTKISSPGTSLLKAAVISLKASVYTLQDVLNDSMGPSLRYFLSWLPHNSILYVKLSAGSYSTQQKMKYMWLTIQSCGLKPLTLEGIRAVPNL